jgi:hypothetical protein
VSALARLAAFGAVLVVVFGVATYAGGAVAPLHDPAPEPSDDMGMDRRLFAASPSATAG